MRKFSIKTLVIVLAALIVFSSVMPMTVAASAEKAVTAAVTDSDAAAEPGVAPDAEPATKPVSAADAAAVSASDEAPSADVSDDGVSASDVSASNAPKEALTERVSSWTKTVDGVTVSVFAVDGVLPENAELRVVKAPEKLAEQAEKVVGAAEEDECRTFDISLLADGKEIQPNTGNGKVLVTFRSEELADAQDVAVYHFNDDVTEAEDLRVTGVGSTYMVAAEHFSLYMLKAAPAPDDIASGTLGTCSWIIDKDGKLTIFPTDGVSGSFSTSEFGGPFAAYTDEILSVTVDPGVSLTGRGDNLFGSCSKMVYADLSNLDVSGCTRMAFMFSGCSSLSSVNMSGWNTANVETMTNMFSGCSSLASVDVSGFDTSKCTSFSRMFFSCRSLKSIDLSALDVSSLQYISYMFESCDKLESVKTGAWELSVNQMMGIFSDCSALKSVDAGKWKLNGCTDLSYIFTGCASLSSLDLSGWDVSGVNNFYAAFSGCDSLTSLDISGWDTSGSADMDSMFAGDFALKRYEISAKFDAGSNYFTNNFEGLVNKVNVIGGMLVYDGAGVAVPRSVVIHKGGNDIDVDLGYYPSAYGPFMGDMTATVIFGIPTTVKFYDEYNYGSEEFELVDEQTVFDDEEPFTDPYANGVKLPKTGKQFVGWRKTPYTQDSDPIELPQILHIDANYTNRVINLYAQYATNRYTVTATAGEGGRIGDSYKTQSVMHGSEARILVIPETGYRIKSIKVKDTTEWNYDRKTLETTNTGIFIVKFNSVTADTDVAVTFEPFDPIGITMGDEFLPNEEIKFTATGSWIDDELVPNDVKYVPDNWYHDSGTVSGSFNNVDDPKHDYSDTFKQSAPGTYTLTVEFKKYTVKNGVWNYSGIEKLTHTYVVKEMPPVNIICSSTGSGALSPDPSNGKNIPYGSDGSVFIMTYTYNRLAKLTVDGVEYDRTKLKDMGYGNFTLTLENMTKDVYVDAVFERMVNYDIIMEDEFFAGEDIGFTATGSWVTDSVLLTNDMLIVPLKWYNDDNAAPSGDWDEKNDPTFDYSDTFTQPVGNYTLHVFFDVYTYNAYYKEWSRSNYPWELTHNYVVKAAPLTVTAEAGKGGTATPASQTVEYDGDANVVIKPESGYRIAKVTVNGADYDRTKLAVSGSSFTLSLTNIVVNTAVKVTFEPFGKIALIMDDEFSVDDDIPFTAKGSWVGDATLLENDVKYVPSNWHHDDPKGDWGGKDDPTFDYSDKFRQPAGKYTIHVIFNKFIYKNGAWVADGTEELLHDYVVKAPSGNSPEGPKTGEDVLPLILFANLLILSTAAVLFLNHRYGFFGKAVAALKARISSEK